jgi:hypothetical protein
VPGPSRAQSIVRRNRPALKAGLGGGGWGWSVFGVPAWLGGPARSEQKIEGGGLLPTLVAFENLRNKGVLARARRSELAWKVNGKLSWGWRLGNAKHALGIWDLNRLTMHASRQALNVMP